MQEEPDRRFVFVAGPPRAGTTMLSLILGSHPEVCVMPEVGCVPRLLTRFPPGLVVEDDKLRSLRNIIYRDLKLKSVKADLTRFWEKLEKYRRIDIRSVIADLLGSYRDVVSPEAIILGHKKNYLEIGDMLKVHIPEAKIVAIFRDPRDCAISAAENLPMHSVESAALAWKRRASQCDRLRSRYSDDILEIRYESLLEDSIGEAQRLCGFLGIDYDQQMLEFYQDNRDLARISYGQEEKHKNTSMPMRLDRKEAWRRRSDSSLIRRVELLCSDGMQKRGYRFSSEVKPRLNERLRTWWLIRKDTFKRRQVRSKQLSNWSRKDCGRLFSGTGKRLTNN